MSSVAKRFATLAWILVVLALVTVLTPQAESARVDPMQFQMLKNGIPMRVGGWVGEEYPPAREIFQAIPDASLVSRTYRDPAGKEVDFTVIMSESNVDFHDPRFCFQAHGWAIGNVRRIRRPAAGGQDLQAFLCTITRGRERMEAIYFYAWPRGQLDSTWKVHLSALWDATTRREPEPVYFVRFMYDPKELKEPQMLAALDSFWARLRGPMLGVRETQVDFRPQYAPAAKQRGRVGASNQ